MSERLQESAGISTGQRVKVRPADPDKATSLSLASRTDLSYIDDGVLKRGLKTGLNGTAVCETDEVIVERISDEPFLVVETTPRAPVKVDNQTSIEIVEEPPDNMLNLQRPSGSDQSQSQESGSSGGGADTEETSYNHIGGLSDEINEVREMVERPLTNPEVFDDAGIEPPKGGLLYGPPGTGKTLIAKAVAQEVDASFFEVSGPEVISKYKGQSGEEIQSLFEDAAEQAPSIIFFDEIDAIAPKRGEKHGVNDEVVTQLLTELDGVESRGEVIVLGATNRVDEIDPALRRGGRFDREVEIGVPDEDDRKEILQIMTREVPLGDNVSVGRLAERTHGFVGADLDTLVTEAAMEAIPRFEQVQGTDEQAYVQWRDFETALAATEPSAMREVVAEVPSVSFDDIGGLEDAQQALEEAVEWPLACSDLFEDTATDPPSGVLLHGPPGTGKTMLAKAIAGESDVNFIHVDGGDIMDKYIGESEKAVKGIFERARQAAPSIVFLDEIDAVAGQRGNGVHEAYERVLSQLLTEIDGVSENDNLVLLGATNRKQAIDDALLRPGRLETHVEVPAPDQSARESILEVHTREKPLGENVEIGSLAEKLEGYTGADLEAVVRKASLQAIRGMVETHGMEEANRRSHEAEITADHFETAIEEVEPTMDSLDRSLR
jgi:transitional endoplasmic reticulum ATPase